MAEVCHSTSQNDKNRLAWVAVAGAILGACLCLPFADDPGFERNKALAVACCAALLLAAAHLQRISRLGLAIAVALAMSVITSLDPARALIGSLERSQGVLLLGALSVFALARLPWPICRFWIVMATLLSGSWALIQFAGMEAGLMHLNWENSDWQASAPHRIFAGFGNPTALGGFLAMSIPVCAELFKQSTRVSARIFSALALALGVFALLASGTRAALLGLAIAVLAAAWLQRYRNQNRARWPHVLGASLLALAALVVVLAYSPRQASIHHRIELWGDAGTALADAAQSKVLLRAPFTAQFSGELPVERYVDARIWLGFGADMQSVPLAAARSRQQAADLPAPFANARFSDRAHNLFLDALLEFGLIGTVLLSIWLLRGIFRLRCEPWRLCAALAGLLSWQAGFPLTAEKLVFVLVICAMPTHQMTQANSAEALRLSRIMLSALALAASVYCFGPWLASANYAVRKPESAYRYFQSATAAFEAGQFELAQQRYARAVAEDPWRIDLRMALAQAEVQLRASAIRKQD